MAGHSKWANIKHKKAAADSKKGKVFTKMAKNITVAAQQGGGDPGMNAPLRIAIQNAKSAGVPNDNIDRAIKKGTGELKGDTLSEITYEGYGPDGVAILIRTLTDNNNRSYTNTRIIMTKNGGSLGGSGCVAYLFQRKGVIEAKTLRDHDEIELRLIDSGAEEITWDDNIVRVLSPPEVFEQCVKVFNEEEVQNAEISLIAEDERIISDVQTAQKIIKLIELLEDDDDVDEVFTNADFSEEVLKSIENE